jgi:hypothetical protein
MIQVRFILSAGDDMIFWNATKNHKGRGSEMGLNDE